jgi:hypothetical protein
LYMPLKVHFGADQRFGSHGLHYNGRDSP